MPNIRLIRRRIRSIQSTAKITHAMEMIAASKMRRAQERGLAGRPYETQILGVLGHLAALRQEGDPLHPLLQVRPVQRIEVIHMTADRGLCGPLNSNMNRFTSSFLLHQEVPVSLVVVGRRGRDFMNRYGRDIRAEFTNLGDWPNILDILPISRVVIEDYINGYADRVFVAFTRFITTMTQRPELVQLLPVVPAPPEAQWNVDYIYEPSSAGVLDTLLPRYVEMEIYHAMLEHIASEHSARMVAMRNASENANDIIRDLTLMYNKARQEMITKELLDIVGGAEALRG